MNIPDAIAQATSNQLLASGLVLGLVGTLVAALRNVPQKLLVLIKDQVSIGAEIRDEGVFAAYAEWLAAQPYGARCRRFSATLSSGNGAPLVFAPGRGHHVFRYQGRVFWLERSKEEAPPIEGAKALGREYMMLRVWGRNPEPVRAMLDGAVEFARSRREGKCVVYANDGWGRWDECGISDGRPLPSVILRAGLREEIVADVEMFRASSGRYRELGIPHRRVYLFHGPPRTGKSSIIAAIASHLSAPMYILSLSAPRMTDDHLLTMMRSTAPGACILIEDVDAAWTKRVAGDGTASAVTFSGLLNAIDGVGAQQGRAIFMTTNHRERLEPALLERVDMDREITYCDHDQLRRMFLRFFPEEPALASQFADLRRGEEIAPCAVQRHLMLHWDDAYAAAGTGIETPIEQEEALS